MGVCRDSGLAKKTAPISDPCKNPRPMTARTQQPTRRTPTWIRKFVIWSAVAVFAVWLVECLYYYNTFVAMTSKLAGDLSDCEVAMQERHHVTVRLAHVVVAYSSTTRTSIPT
jgi:hypothetical protein